MEYIKRTGRALQLDGLEKARNKVTLGFKCDAGTKIRLAKEANENGMTLSEYVDTIIDQRHTRSPTDTTTLPAAVLVELDEERRKVRQLEDRLAVFEQNPFLVTLLTKYRNQVVEYLDNSTGRSQKLRIERLEDVFKVVISSFQSPRS
jgi:hypothetical protein